ncbi:MAG: class I SAM-dependent methyltransferase [Actinomycetota bacterium]|nr:class I SAM-dependent methyltransferase [Actinomycetota bacterium]
MAVPLTSYLSPEGSYRGFDVVKESVRWCTRRITPHYDTFRFDHVDVYNKHYNPGGTLNANSFDFPYPDASFDFVFLISVFTHLLPPDMKNYLSEVARVLAPGGRSFITYTLLNDEILRSIERGKSHLPYVHLRDGYRTVEPDEPETSVAFYEEDVRALYDALRLQIIEPIRFGSWSGRDGDSHQDIVVARKLN